MKFSGLFEVSGISRLVIDQSRVWLKEITRSGQVVWRLEHTERRKPDRYILGRIQHYINDEEYRVWFHNETCNVQKLPTTTDFVAIVSQTRKSSPPFIKAIESIVTGSNHGTSRTKANHR
jgi:hypothetical protein